MPSGIDIFAGYNAALGVGKTGGSEKAELAFEDWTSNIEFTCKACSEGTLHQHPPVQAPAAWTNQRNCAFAARSEAEVQSVLTAWVKGKGMLARLLSRRSVVQVERVL